MNLLRKLRGSDAQIKPEITHYGIKLLLPESISEYELLKLLTNTPSSAYKLPKGKGIVFDFGGRECSRKLILNVLQSVVWQKEINILAWLSRNPASVKLFSVAGLCYTEPPMEIDTSRAGIEASDTYEVQHVPRRVGGLKIVYSSMRSGQRVEADGDVVVWGHLNPGAEVEAGGSILVAGRLLGVVHAGASGRSDVFLWAGCFETPQVRIANKLCYADPKSTACWRKGVLITLEDNTPVIREYKFFPVGSKA